MLLQGAGISKFFGDGRDGAFNSDNLAYANLLTSQQASILSGAATADFTCSTPGVTGTSQNVVVVNNAIYVHEGTYAIYTQLTNQGAGGSAPLRIDTSPKPAPVTAGLPYTFQVWTRGLNLDISMKPGIQWLDGSGAAIYTSWGTLQSVSQSTYKQLSVTATAPAGAVKAVCAVESAYTNNNGTIIWDEAMLSQSGTVQTWTGKGRTYEFPVGTEDGPLAVKQFTSFTLNSGVTVTTSNRCKGLVILCTGDVIINGTLSMSGKAAIATAPDGPLIMPLAVSKLYHPGKALDSAAKQEFLVIGPGGRGGRGGDGGYAANQWHNNWQDGGDGGLGADGWWWGGGYGGGGGGGCGAENNAGSTGSYQQNGNGGDGSPTTAPGVGGAGAAVNSASSIYNAKGSNGGAGAGGGGGASTYGGAFTAGSGGAGPGGGGGGGGGAANGTSGAAGNAYGGGLILIIAAGNIIVGGTIVSAGGAGGAGGAGNRGDTNCGASGGGGGGGGGGGLIYLLYGGTYSLTGSLSVSGGAGGGGGAKNTDGTGSSAFAGYSGQVGQPGTIVVKKVS